MIFTTPSSSPAHGKIAVKVNASACQAEQQLRTGLTYGVCNYTFQLRVVCLGFSHKRRDVLLDVPPLGQEVGRNDNPLAACFCTSCYGLCDAGPGNFHVRSHR